jgi:hypothetical protein
MRYCRNCKKKVEPEKRVSLPLFIAGVFLTGGASLLLYPIYYIFMKPYNCPLCGGVESEVFDERQG